MLTSLVPVRSMAARSNTGDRWPGRAASAVIVLVALAMARLLIADDVVHVRSGKDGHAGRKYAGTVLDYSGSGLVLETPDGRTREFPSDRIARLETERTSEELAARSLIARHDYQAALAQYMAAGRAEKRAWVRRQLLAALIECHRELGQYKEAGELFAELARRDPNTPDFHVIPLAWHGSSPSSELEQAAREWLENADSSVARLLGASHLLVTSQRDAALDALHRLGDDADRRIALLATAQSWRTALPQAAVEQAGAWAAFVDKLPLELRAGPLLVAGKALAAKGDPMQGAMLLLQVPVLFGRQRGLSGEALWSAGVALEGGGHPRAAAIAFYEVASSFAEAGQGPAAHERLAELAKIHSPPPRQSVTADDGEPWERRFVNGLNARGMFEVSTAFCHERLNNMELDSQSRARLTVDHAESFVAWATSLPAEDRPPRWAAATRACDDYLATHSGSPFRVLVESQRGLIALAESELNRQETETSLGDDSRLESARTALRNAITQLGAARNSLAVTLRRTNLNRPGSGEGLSADELNSLDKHLGFRLARAFRGQAESYPQDSADRSAALLKAAEQLEPLVRLDPLEPLACPARLEAAICERLRGNLANAAELLAELIQDDIPDAWKQRARAEQVRLELSRGRLAEALAAGARRPTDPATREADLDYALLEAVVANWQDVDHPGGDPPDAKASAPDRDSVKAWQNQANQIVKEFHVQHLPYWQRRAETLLARLTSTNEGALGHANQVRAAEGYFRGGQVDAALAAYDRARDMANAAKDLETAFTAGYSAAAIEQQRGNQKRAAERFRELALQYDDHPRAGETHLLAIFNLGQDASGGAANLSACEELLLEHFAHWPTGDSATRARVWQGKLAFQRGRWLHAFQAFRQVTPGNLHWEDAVIGAARSIERGLESPHAIVFDGPALREARAYFEAIVASIETTDATWTSARRHAALAATRIQLASGSADFDQVRGWLQSALADDVPFDSEWTTRARGALVVALAALGDVEAAADQLGQIGKTEAHTLLVLAEELLRVSGNVSSDVEQRLGQLGVRAMQGWSEASSSDPLVQRRAKMIRVRLQVAAGQRETALAAAKSLAEQQPDRGDVQELYAELLAEAGDRVSQEESARAWGRISRRCRPGSERWFRAMYTHAKVLHQLGRTEAAREILRGASELHPDLGGPQMKSLIEDLKRTMNEQPSAP